MTVIEGRIEITVDGKKTVQKAGEPPSFIPVRAVHSMKGFKGERLVLREQADPAGIYKAMYASESCAIETSRERCF